MAYTSTAVTFSPADDIVDANGGLAFIENDDVFRLTIAGSATTNPGTHIMDKAGAAAVEVSASLHGTTNRQTRRRGHSARSTAATTSRSRPRPRTSARAQTAAARSR